jgi:hypothetical protein
VEILPMIWRWALPFTIVAALSAPAVAAKPPPAKAGGDPDLKCMLVASRLSQNPDPKARTISGLMVFYYFGRLDVRKPGIDLRKALEAQALTVTPAELQAEARRCVTTVSARGQVLQTMSNRPAPPADAKGSVAPATPAPH